MEFLFILLLLLWKSKPVVVVAVVSLIRWVVTLDWLFSYDFICYHINIASIISGRMILRFESIWVLRSCRPWNYVPRDTMLFLFLLHEKWSLLSSIHRRIWLVYLWWSFLLILHVHVWHFRFYAYWSYDVTSTETQPI